MDSKLKSEIREFNLIWHKLIKLPIYKHIEETHKNIQGLKAHEIGIINILSNNENVIIKDLVNKLNIPKSTLTNSINKLEDNEIIEREINPEDKRSYKLVLTEKGKLVQKEHESAEDEIFGVLMKSLDTEEEREEFLRLLNKMIENSKNIQINKNY